MSLFPILLILISALLHCSWNLICKTNRPSSGFFLLVSLVSFALLLPFCLNGLGKDLFSNNRLYLYLLPSSLAQTLYYVSLANSYKANQISLAYPLARSLPVIFVPMVNYIISGETVSLPAMGGMFLIGAGCLLIPPMTKGKKMISFFLSPSFLWIFLAALGTTGYTILDSRGLAYLSDTFSYSKGYLSVFYMTVQSFFIIINLVIYTSANRNERQMFRETVGFYKKSALYAGLFLTLAYLFVLRAMSEGVNVGYLSAMRQASIPLGAIMGMVILDEERNHKKYFAIGLVTAGLVITAQN